MSGDNVHLSPSALEGGIDPRSDVFNRLLKNRVVLLGSDVNDEIANQLCAQLPVSYTHLTLPTTPYV